MISVTALQLEEWRAWREMRLLALQEAPGAFGSTLAEWQGAGDTEQRWRGRLLNVPYNALASLDGKPAGMVGASKPDLNAQTELLSMWVAPWARGRGVGEALLDAVLDWAAANGCKSVVLRVYTNNSNAIALYQRRGFARTGLLESSPGDARVEQVMICKISDDL